jgi:hypothetical protein
MIRTFTAPVSAASDCPVLWRELIPLFRRIFARTIQDAIDNDIRARVHFCGTPFDIIPEIVPGFAPQFSVWGPPHVAKFPDAP